MPYARKIVLHCPNGYDPRLDKMVEQFIQDVVTFVGVVGEDCSRIEDIVDELVVDNGLDSGLPLEDRPFILTASHPGETVEDAIEFASSLTGEYAGDAQVVDH
jgi:hypothetical protein